MTVLRFLTGRGVLARHQWARARCTAFHSSSCLGRGAARDHYEVLGVNRGASSSEIKRAYYRLAKKYHPDSNPDAAAKEMFTAINNSYQVLGDEQKRQQYDQFSKRSFSDLILIPELGSVMLLKIWSKAMDQLLPPMYEIDFDSSHTSQ